MLDRFQVIRNTRNADYLDEQRMKHFKHTPKFLLVLSPHIMLLVSTTGDLQVKSHFLSLQTKFIFDISGHKSINFNRVVFTHSNTESVPVGLCCKSIPESVVTEALVLL